ncbi:MAG TPA: UDP-N-acetylglucosamine 2-epimerase, partial [Flavobacteriales bacterium]|nr:UDP-N-acetylglucosamine 2-epimerase [Flavobacteriales bacterium]
IVCDQCSSWLFCPTSTAVDNLANEGYTSSSTGIASPERPIIDLCGDVMFDNSLHFAKLAKERSTVMRDMDLATERFILATIHRDHNTDDAVKLAGILTTLAEVSEQHQLQVVLPLHPRTKARIGSSLPSTVQERVKGAKGLRIIDPVGFLDMIELERNAKLVLTDSGGVQKEAFFFGKPCVILREETEWVELVEHGQAVLAGADPVRIASATEAFLKNGMPTVGEIFGNGRAAERVCDVLLRGSR